MHKRMNLTSSELELLLVLYRFKSLTASARHLNLEQSTLSRRLDVLEEKCGHLLFSRGRKGLIPNSRVQKLIPWAEKLEVLLREANKSGSSDLDDPKGEVHITAPDVISDCVIAPALNQFFQKNPFISLKITATSQVMDLDRLECDIAIRIGQPPKGQNFFVKVADSDMAIYGDRKFLIEGSVQSLSHLPLLIRSESAFQNEKWLSKIKAKNIALVSNRMTTCLAAAASGAGVVLLPKVFGDRQTGLVRIPVEEDLENLRMPLFLICPESVRKLKYVDLTWTWLRQILKG